LLTFTRKPGQGIRIGEEIRVTVKEVRGKQVRLVIEAPRAVKIYREELFQQIAAENERAACVNPSLLDRLK
jgi:carbon storage regulator